MILYIIKSIVPKKRQKFPKMYRVSFAIVSVSYYLLKIFSKNYFKLGRGVRGFPFNPFLCGIITHVPLLPITNYHIPYIQHTPNLHSRFTKKYSFSKNIFSGKFCIFVFFFWIFFQSIQQKPKNPIKILENSQRFGNPRKYKMHQMLQKIP